MVGGGSHAKPYRLGIRPAENGWTVAFRNANNGTLRTDR